MKRHIRLLAHNIRSLWNVGALFRTCDAMGIELLYLSGYTAAPPKREISKTAIGAEEWIPWEAVTQPVRVIEALRKEGWTVVALETSSEAVALREYTPAEKTCLIVGHEVTGVPEEVLRACNAVVRIPMHGKKESLNVSVAAGIALDHLRNHDLHD